MPTPPKFLVPCRAAGLVLAGMTVLATVHGASAEEGLGGFLRSVFGGAGQQEAAPASAPVYQHPERPTPVIRHSSFRAVHQRPLVVRLHKAAPRPVAALLPVKPGKVSIFEDRTLKRGDAVMTADGIRVFAGSASWPYAKADFVDLAVAKDLNQSTAKVLAAVDRLPRG